jgi:hypothetical protein
MKYNNVRPSLEGKLGYMHQRGLMPFGFDRGSQVFTTIDEGRILEKSSGLAVTGNKSKMQRHSVSSIGAPTLPDEYRKPNPGSWFISKV